MRSALVFFVVAALSVQQAISLPFAKRAIDGVYNIHLSTYFAYCVFFFSFTLDTTILNYALTLEHLENAFYSGGLGQFNDQAFKDAGLASWVRPRFLEIAAHEATHVTALSSALGANATQPCTYSLYVFFFFLNGVSGGNQYLFIYFGQPIQGRQVFCSPKPSARRCRWVPCWLCVGVYINLNFFLR